MNVLSGSPFRWSAALCLVAPLWIPPAQAQAPATPGHDHSEARRIGHKHKQAGAAKPAAHRDHDDDKRHRGHDHGERHGEGVETENLFGFTLGSDTEEKGARGLAIENLLRFGKRESRYTALGQKVEFAYGLTDDLSASLSLLGDYHRVRARPLFADSVEEVNGRYLFNGVGGEIRYRIFDRKISPFGLTLHLEPSIAFSDEASGLRGRKYGSENKFIFDREVIAEKLFVAFNLTHEIEVTREKNAPEWERGATVGASLAAAYQIMPNLFLGAETRYLRSYDRLNLKTYNGDAWYVGPTVSARFGHRYWASLAYSGLVGGSAKGSGERFDLGNFERHQVRLKAGLEF